MTDTHTEQQIQAMRNWLAVEMLGWKIDREPIEGTDDPKIIKVYHRPNEASIRVDKWIPDINPEQRDLVMDTFHAINIFRHDPSTPYQVSIRLPHQSQFMEPAINKSLGLACMVAACRASGYVE